MFYETCNSMQNDQIRIDIGLNMCFPSHFHSSFEFITVTEGEICVTVDKNKYLITPGNGILVFPNQSHSLHTEHYSRHVICIFSSQFVQSYRTVFKSMRPKNPQFPIDSFYIQQLVALKENKNLLQIKGFLYSLCALLDQNTTYYKFDNKKEELLFKIFQFVENNYQNDCTLSALAAETGYHSVYLSRYFKQHTEQTFSDYVNHYRIYESAYQLQNSDKKILDVALACGYDSLRSFNRSFKRILNATPSKYRSTIITVPQSHSEMEG